MSDSDRFTVNTRVALQLLLGDIDQDVQSLLVGQPLTREQCTRLLPYCGVEIERQHPLLQTRPVPANTPEGQKLERERWISHMITCKGASIWLTPFVPAQTFPLRDILFLVADWPLNISDMQGVHKLVEFLVDVSNTQPWYSPNRRWRARKALLERFPLLCDVDPPFPPLGARSVEQWIKRQELRFGTTLLVTALTPTEEPSEQTPKYEPIQANTKPGTGTREGFVMTVPQRVGAYS